MKQTIDYLHSLLLYFNMQELRDLAQNLNLSRAGLKLQLIQKIMSKLSGGQHVLSSAPQYSAKRQKEANLAPEKLILQAEYKNNLRIRLFFKDLIGEHFHFTVFGHDWLKARWAHNQPPTYQEFADFWQQEYALRKQGKREKPKEEWAYLTYLANGGAKENWKRYREAKVTEGKEIINQLIDRNKI